MIKTDVFILVDLSILNIPEEGSILGREVGEKGVHFTFPFLKR